MPIAPNATLNECLESVGQRAPQALARCIEEIAEALEQEELQCPNVARRQELAEARHELLGNKAAWCRRYRDELLQSFRAILEQRTPAGVAVQIETRAQSGGLALVDDSQVMHAIEVSRVVEHAMADLEQSVAELDALVSTAMGLDNVRSDFNPLRPDAFAQSFRRVVEQTAPDSAARTIWMQRLAAPLTAQLQQIYGAVASELRAAGIQPARYGRSRGHGAAHQGGTAPAAGDGDPDADWSGQHGGTAPREAADQHAALPPEAIRAQSLRRFLANDSESAAAALTDDYYARVNAEIAQALQQPRRSAAPFEPGEEYRALAPVDRPARAVDVQTVLREEHWGEYADPRRRSLVRGHLRREATQVGQVFGLEIVRRVIGEVVQDPRLLTPVREAIVASEPVLLRLALIDPRFLNDEDHPGRRLIEEIAQRSFNYNDEFASEFGEFFGQINGALRGLNDVELASAEPVEAALRELRSRWRTQDDEHQAQRLAALEALRFAEQRQAAAEAIAAQLGLRYELERVPDIVQEFLYGPWAIVLAHQRLTAEPRDEDPLGYWAAIDDLLWSVDRQQTLQNPARMFELVPPLLAKLREGLASIGAKPEEHERFFDGFMKLHRPVLKLRAKSRHGAHELAHLMAELPHDPAPGPDARQEDDRPWMTAQDLGVAGFEDTLPTDMGPLLAAAAPRPEHSPAPRLSRPAAPPSPAAEPLGDEEVAATIDGLQEGDWVDLYSRRRWRRAQLVWTGTHRTLFMFVSHGGQPHSMTRRMCERLVRTHFLRPVARHEVVGRALQVLGDSRVAELVA